MIHLSKRNETCPVCGSLSKNFKLEGEMLRNCPVCGTIFNEFAIILTQESDNETMRNKIINN